MKQAKRTTAKIGLHSINVVAGDTKSVHVSLEDANAAIAKYQAEKLCNGFDVTIRFQDQHHALITLSLFEQPNILTKFLSMRESVRERLRLGFGEGTFERNMARGYRDLDARLAAFFAKYAIADNEPVDILAYWRERVTSALAAVSALKVEFATNLQDRSPDNREFFAHSNEMATIVGAGIDPDATEWDEESLPFATLQFEDGVKLEAFDDEIFSKDARLHSFIAAVSGGFAVAREMDFVGPFHLAAEGTDAQKLQFITDLAAFKIDDCAQGRNTPLAYRTADGATATRKEEASRNTGAQLAN